MIVPARAATAVLGTIAAVALLASFRTPDTTATRVAGLPAAPSGDPTPAAQPAAAGAGTATDQAGPAASTATPAPSPAGGSHLRDGRYSGEDVSMRYGDVQVRVVVSGGRITDVQAVQLPSDRSRSAYISQVAGPMLHDEVLTAQSAQIDTISGATYTSDAYAQSVQAALDQAHA
ncbi:MAG TPA: FMN-binding protein [Candidatus Dormibacteraeota bacterium]|jgi:uncharacterized protein with FMN-binding domain